MGSFDSGFRMGQSAYQQALDNRRQQEQDERQKVLDERAALEWQQRLDDRTRAKELEREVDTAFADDARLRTSGMVYDPMPSGGAVGPLPEDQQPKVSGALGLQPAGAVPFGRSATAIDYEQSLGRIAGARRDLQGMRTSADKVTELKWDQDFTKFVKDYKGDDDQIGATAEYVNENSKTLTIGEPDKNGVVGVSVVRPNKRAIFLNLSKAEQARLYAAVNMMDRDPTKAYGIISGINKDLAAAVKADNDLTKDGATTGNAAAQTTAGITGAAETRAETGRHNKEQERIGGIQANAAVTSAGAAALNARTNQQRQQSEDEERKATRKDRDAAVKAINDVLPTFNALTPEEQRGPKGQALITQAGLNSALSSGDASKMLMALRERIGASGRKAVGKIEKAGDNSGFLVFDTDNKLMENMTNSGLSLPPGVNEDAYNAIRKEADKAGVVADSVIDPKTGNRVIGYTSATGHDYRTLAEAKADKDGKNAAKAAPPGNSTAPPRGMPPAPAQPWVDRPGNVLTRDVAPAVNSFAASTQADYLKGKLSRGEPLNPAEQVRAKQYGLTK